MVFRYLEPQQRHGQSSLEDLIAYLTHQTDEEIQNGKRKLHQANERLVSIEKKLVADYRMEIEAKIQVKNEELAAHESVRPPKKPIPANTGSTLDAAQIENFTREIADYSEAIEQLRTERTNLSRVPEELRQVKEAIKRNAGELTGLELQFDAVLRSVGLAFGDIVKIELDYSGLDAVVAASVERLGKIKKLLANQQDIVEMFRGQIGTEEAIAITKSESFVYRKEVLEGQKAQLVHRQAKPAREYQTYQTQLAAWNARRNEILGDDQNPAQDSLKGLQEELEKIKSVYPENRQEAQAKQVQISNALFQKKRELTRVYDQIKQSIDAEIAKFRGDLGDYSISIEAGLRFSDSFYDTFLEFINQGRKGSFHGIEEGRIVLHGLCHSVDDWENETEVFIAIKEIVNALHVDKRSDFGDDEDNARNVFTQMKNQKQPVIDLYDYLFSFDYLKPKYDLKVDQKDLSQLSPGERGGLLLIFYLILDRRDVPLVIDQPEDNLDNKSVYEILVTFIKHAKKRRQIILVTHNPNLAVVADAEQIIHVSIDKEDGRHDFDFFSGSIEAPEINRAVVDILEGTLPAFDNRRLKYRRRR